MTENWDGDPEDIGDDDPSTLDIPVLVPEVPEELELPMMGDEEFWVPMEEEEVISSSRIPSRIDSKVKGIMLNRLSFINSPRQ